MQAAKLKFNKLTILNVNQIKPHEIHDRQRDLPLANKIKKMNMFTNPILVAHVAGNTYMQVDGANRLNAMKYLKIPNIPVQVVDYNDPEMVDVSTWSHITPIGEKTIIEGLSKIKNIHFQEDGYRYLRSRYMKDRGDGYLCTIVFNPMKIYRVSTGGSLTDKITNLKEIVAIYQEKYSREILPEKTDSVDVAELFKKYPGYASLIIFPNFTRHQIINAAVYEKTLLPPGITRFIINGRYLDLNYPLKKLKSKTTLQEKQKELETFVKTKKTRRYEEPSIYFEP